MREREELVRRAAPSFQSARRTVAPWLRFDSDQHVQCKIATLPFLNFGKTATVATVATPYRGNVAAVADVAASGKAGEGGCDL